MARLADALTASRLVLAPAIGLMVAAGEFGAASVFLVVAWITDSLDGAAARAAQGGTRLGEWDFRIDLLLGVALLGGLGASDRVLPAVALAGIVAGIGGTVILANPAPGMLMMALGYSIYLGVLLSERPALWWLPLVAIPAMIAIEWRRTVTVIFPAFFKSVVRLSDQGRPEAGPVLDQWAMPPSDLDASGEVEERRHHRPGG